MHAAHRLGALGYRDALPSSVRHVMTPKLLTALQTMSGSNFNISCVPLALALI